MGWFCRNQAVIRTDCPKYCPVGRRWVKSFKECTCKKTMWERWCPWEILISREVDRARQISGAISQTSSKSNNEQFISDHWSSMAAYQRRRIPALSLVSQTGSTRFPGTQLVPHQATRPGKARPTPRSWHWLNVHWWKHSMSTQDQCVNRPAARAPAPFVVIKKKRSAPHWNGRQANRKEVWVEAKDELNK